MILCPIAQTHVHRNISDRALCDSDAWEDITLRTFTFGACVQHACSILSAVYSVFDCPQYLQKHSYARIYRQHCTFKSIEMSKGDFSADLSSKFIWFCSSVRVHIVDKAGQSANKRRITHRIA